MRTSALSPQWETFRMLQELAYRRTSSKKMHAAELALDRVLDSLLDGSVMPALAHQKFKTVTANRARVDRHRAARLASAVSPTPPQCDGFKRVALHEEARGARSKLTVTGSGSQWDLLLAVGVGYSLQEIANGNGEKVGTIKARISRARALIRPRAA